MPELSIIVVNFRGGRFIDMLLQSLRRTMTDPASYDVVIVNNFIVGYTGNTLIERGKHWLVHYARDLVKGIPHDQYMFRIPDNVTVKTVNTGSRPIFWHKNMNIRAKAVSLSHAAGLRIGSMHITSDAEFVLLLDHDIVFLKRDWKADFLGAFQDPDVMVVGAFRAYKIFDRPFVRPFCLMYRRSFFCQFPDPFRPTAEGDTCAFFTHWCESQGKRIVVFANSWDDPNLRQPGLGEIAFDSEKRILLAHRGHSSERVASEAWLDRMRSELAIRVEQI